MRIPSLMKKEMKMEKKIVTIEIKKGEDGHWLNFKDSTGKHASINIENTFPMKGITHRCIKQWAVDQFEKD